MRYKNIKILVATIFGLSLFFLVNQKEADFSAPPVSIVPKEKVYTKDGKNHSVVEIIKVKEVEKLPISIQIEIDSMKQLIANQKVNIERFQTFNVAKVDTGKMQVITDTLWIYENKYTDFKLNPITLDFNYKTDIQLTQIDYAKRGLFKRKTSYSDVFSVDENVSINSQKSIRIEHKNKTPLIRPGVHVGYGYLPFEKEHGVVVSVGLNVNL